MPEALAPRDISGAGGVPGVAADKAVVITGTGRGIGMGHATVLAAEAARVVVNDVDLDEARAVVSEIEAAAGTAVANGDDIGTRAGCESLVAQCVEAFGRIDAALRVAAEC